MKPIEVIAAPSNLGLKPPAPGKEPAVSHAPDALVNAGIIDKLTSCSFRRVEPPQYSSDDARLVNIRNVSSIAIYTRKLADAISISIQCGRFPLVLGGDCSIVLGAALALRRLGRYGLLFIDGHTDFYLPEQSRTGGAAGMDLALATGWGPQELTNVDHMKPYFRTEDVLLLGNRDLEDRPAADIPTLEDSGMDYWSLARLRASGTIATAERQLAALMLAPIEGFWIHLDVDALDDSIMPAVDSRQPDGLTWHEIGGIMRAAIATNRVIGAEVTIFDPTLDVDGSLASVLTDNIVHWFTS